jgi:hypothetical protein
LERHISVNNYFYIFALALKAPVGPMTGNSLLEIDKQTRQRQEVLLHSALLQPTAHQLLILARAAWAIGVVDGMIA